MHSYAANKQTFPLISLQYTQILAEKKSGVGDRERMRFERIASTVAVRTCGDFGIFQSPYSGLEIYVELCRKVLAFVRIFDYNERCFL